MLKIFDANTETAAAEAVFAELMKNNNRGSRHIVLAPDRYSLSAEKKIFEFTGLQGAMNIDVYSFTNLAKRAVKGLPKCLSKEGTVILLREVLRGTESELEYYTAVSKSKTFARELFAVMASIRNSGISPEDLYGKFAEGNDTASRKYRDIARIYGEYERVLKKRYTDTTGRLDALIEAAPNLKEITESHFYAVGFFNFNRKQLSILEAILKNAKSLNIAAVTSVGGENDALYGNKFRSDMEKLRRATGSGYEWNREDVPLKESIGGIAKRLFSYRTGSLPKTDDVILFRENTPYDELKAVGREIRRLVRREGYRYKEIAVAAYDERYKHVFRDVFGRFGIPYFTDTKYELRSAASVRYFTEALEVLKDNFKQSSVLAFVKNPLFPSPAEDVDAFENYVLKYNIDYRGFSGFFVYGEEEERSAADRVRETIFQELPDFPEDLTVEAAVDRSAAFFTEELSAREAALLSDAEEARKKLQEQAAELLIRELTEMAEILGDKKTTVKEFRDAALSAIGSVSVSLIPVLNDCVFVGTGEESALYGIRALFIVGAAEGVVPPVAGYQAIMPEKDVFRFEKKGIPLYPTPTDRLREEKAKLVNLFLKAEERVYVGCPYFNLMSEPLEPSEFFKGIVSVSGYPVQKLSDRFRGNLEDPTEAEDFLVSAENALYEYRLATGRGKKADAKRYLMLGRALKRDYGVRDFPVDADMTLKPDKRTLYFGGDRGGYVTSASELERYAACPFRHFLDYGLRIREREVAETKSSDVGSIVHRALELFFKNTKKRLRNLSDREIARETEKAIDAAFLEEKASVLKNAKFGKILFRSLKNQLTEVMPKLADAVKRSSFDPEFIEYFFDKNRGAAEIETEFGTVYLTGKIDRADVYDKDLFLVDYKTGSRVGSLTELYLGSKVQLALYALPFRKEGYRIVGAYYLPLPDGYRSDGRTLQFVGNTLNAASAISALDRNADGNGEFASEYFPFKTKKTKDGFVLAAKSGSYLLSEAEFSALLDLAKGGAQNALTEIDAGYAAKRPLEGQCDYCPYTPLCGGKRPRKPLKAEWKEGALWRTEREEEEE